MGGNRFCTYNEKICNKHVRADSIAVSRGITLIALIITIILMLILAGVVLNLTIGENDGLIGKAKEGANETNKQIATEKINLKITNSQMHSYADAQRMPTLQELADDFCEDNEIQYVTLESKRIAGLEKIDVGKATSIFTKLKDYPYEFEINSSLELASVDGVKKEKEINNFSKVYYLGDGNTFDLNALKEEGKLPKDLDLSSISIDNFIVGISSVSSGSTDVVQQDHWSRGWLFGSAISKEYDKTSGILNVSNTIVLRGRAEWAGGGESKDLTLSNPTFAYLVIGTIENK